MVKFTIRPINGAKGTTYMVDIKGDGERRRVIKKTEAEAKAEVEKYTRNTEVIELTRRFKDDEINVRNPKKVSDALRNYIAIKETEITDPFNQRAFKYILKYIYDALFDLKVDYVHEINYEVLQLVRAYWAKKGHSNATINKRFGSLRTFLNVCVKWKCISKNEALEFKPLPEEQPVMVIMSPQDYRRLEANIAPWAQAIFGFIYETACRPIEATRLKVAHVNFEKKVALLYSMKGNRPGYRECALTERTVAILKKAIEKNGGSEFVFTGPRGKPVVRQKIAYQVLSARRRLGLSDKLTPYSARRGLITELGDMDVAISKIQQIAGHRRVETTMRYTHLPIESSRKVLQNLEKKRDSTKR